VISTIIEVTKNHHHLHHQHQKLGKEAKNQNDKITDTQIPDFFDKLTLSTKD
jgi:hypothetical protein